MEMVTNNSATVRTKTMEEALVRSNPQGAKGPVSPVGLQVSSLRHRVAQEGVKNDLGIVGQWRINSTYQKEGILETECFEPKNFSP